VWVVSLVLEQASIDRLGLGHVKDGLQAPRQALRAQLVGTVQSGPVAWKDRNDGWAWFLVAREVEIVASEWTAGA
jgi:hypothetical protein